MSQRTTLVFNEAFNGLLDIPDWLTVLTCLLRENNDTENLKNYRSMA